MTAHPSPLDVARELLQRGWMPLPVPYREKNPGSRGWKGWQNFTVTEDELPQHFNGQPLNIYQGSSEDDKAFTFALCHVCADAFDLSDQKTQSQLITTYAAKERQ